MALIRRWWVWIIAALLIAALSITLAVRWSVWDPAPQLQRLAMDIPAPAGVHPSGDVSVIGHRPPHDLRCGFTCETERATQLWIADDSSVDVCAALQGAVTRWTAVGFKVSSPDPHAIQDPCDVEGTLHGHPAGAQAVRSDAGGPAQIRFTVRW
jgi:hypothetical protein